MSAERNELFDYIENSLAGDYDMCAALKESEASSVYLYQHKITGSRIIKRVSANRNDDVMRELRGLSIANLANILEVCSAEDKQITLEQYIEGRSLEEVLKDGLLELPVACSYICDICGALSELHERNIIHRDIKPSNIIIRGDGRANLIDLGIARKINSLSDRDTQSLGTAGYAAPEQFGIIQSTRETDIYALGVVLNRMLTGAHPSVKTPGGPVGKIISKTTATEISKRYRSASALQKKLKRFI